MAVQELPLFPPEPYYRYTVDLEGAKYGLEFRWNTRDECWYLNVRDAQDNMLLSGRRLAVGFPLLRRFRDLRLPPGELELVDTMGGNTDPGLEDLGQRVLLLYTPTTDFPAGYGLPV